MEKMRMKPQYEYSPSCDPSSASNSKLGMHKDSHIISKASSSKPRIRIIHVFAPEIIKTDVANFRELVQNLTGKPRPLRPPPEVLVNASRKKTVRSSSTYSSPSKKILELQNDDGDDQRVKEEIHGYIWRSSSSSSGDHHQTEKANGFLDGFSDLDGFIEELIK